MKGQLGKIIVITIVSLLVYISSLRTFRIEPRIEPRPLSPESKSQLRSGSNGTTTCNISKATMLYGAHVFPQLEQAVASHRLHSERWGCGFHVLSQDLTDRRLYSKQYYLLSIMLQELEKPVDERQEWLMWVDADSIVINQALPASIFLPPSDIKDVFALVTADHNGLNAGIFFLRVHPSSVDFLTQVLAYPLYNPNEDLGWFGEQAAMANVIKKIEAEKKAEGRASGIAFVPREWFNTYQFEHGFEGKRGDFLVHFAGLGETRLMHMSNWLQTLESSPSEWDVPLDETDYENRTVSFWRQFADGAAT